MSVAPPSSFRDPFTPPSKAAPPVPRPLSKNPLVWIGAAVVALAVVGASTAITIAAWPKKLAPFPFDVARLPATLASVSRWQPDPKMPKEMEASRLARACGGADVVGLALDIEQPFAKEALADAIASREETAKALACGAAVAKDLGDGPRYTITFKDDKSSRVVAVYRTKLPTWPDAGKHLYFSEGPKSLASIACFREGGDGPCAEGAPAIAKVPGTTLWLAGDLADLDVVASAYPSKRATDRAKALEDLAPTFAGYDSVSFGTSDADFYFRALFALDDFKEETRKARDAFKKSLERSDAVCGFGEGRSWESPQDRFEVVTAREEDAKDVFSTLKDLRLALKHADKRDPPEDFTRAEQKAYDAYVSAYKRALDDAEVERDGKTVRLVLNLKAEKAEKEAFADRDKESLERVKHGVALYQALLAGKEPSDEILDAIGGRDLLTTVKDRKDGPPSFDDAGPFVDVSTVPGLSLPPGTADGGGSGTSYFTYDNPKADLVDRIASHLRKTGWSVAVWPGSGGPTLECTKDGNAATIFVFQRKRSVDVDVLAR